jgi:hypothetical protein
MPSKRMLPLWAALSRVAAIAKTEGVTKTILVMPTFMICVTLQAIYARSVPTDWLAMALGLIDATDGPQARWFGSNKNLSLNIIPGAIQGSGSAVPLGK